MRPCFSLLLTLALLPGAHAASSQVMTFSGMCDASGAIPLSASRFAVADDEDNVLRIYDAERGGAPLSTTDLSLQLGLPVELNKKGQPKTPPEVDIEAATLLNGRAYWITSHGRNSKGKLKPERLRFFTTNVPDDSTALQVTAMATADFFNQLLDAPSLRAFNLRAAAELAPKAPGGLNIEGLTAMPDGRLLIGLRNPVPQGLALLVPLQNPAEVMAGKPALFGTPIRLDLGGLGVRSLTWRDNRYLIIAGHYDSGATSRLFLWDGAGNPQAMSPDLSDLNPEGFFSRRQRQAFMLLSDDGSRMIGGKECKSLKDAAAKQFRGLWITPADLTPAR